MAQGDPPAGLEKEIDALVRDETSRGTDERTVGWKAQGVTRIAAGAQAAETIEAQPDAGVRHAAARRRAEVARLPVAEIRDAEHVIAGARGGALHGQVEPRLVRRVEVGKTERGVDHDRYAREPRGDAAEESRLGGEGVHDGEALTPRQPVHLPRRGQVAIGPHVIGEADDARVEAGRLELRECRRADQRFIRRRERHRIAAVHQVARERRDKGAERLRVGRDEQDARGGRAQNFHGFTRAAAG